MLFWFALQTKGKKEEPVMRQAREATEDTGVLSDLVIYAWVSAVYMQIRCFKPIVLFSYLSHVRWTFFVTFLENWNLQMMNVMAAKKQVDEMQH